MKLKLRHVGTGLTTAMLLAAGAVGGWAQGPGSGMGMEPHRPPMEQAMGPGGQRGEMGRWWNNPSAVDKYKLTEPQRKAMDDIYQAHRLTLVDLHASLEKAELTLGPLIRADQPEESKVLSQIDRVAQARAELEKANARMLLGIRKQLTPDQWKQMEADRALRRPGGEMHGGEGPGGQSAGPGAGPGSGPGRGSAPGPGQGAMSNNRNRWNGSKRGPSGQAAPPATDGAPPPPPPASNGAPGPGPAAPEELPGSLF